ncbi:MAG: NAD(P)/FAD-dependent oxidoreductase [Nanoarchaeota archaeon]|nr:NAD(P)/FAD-dependent oxidoreductase [Nanoarchaeota archaeon]MBU1854740.1 NAD(P)/FAD-dependent oxidoreductase [Nanoarchaeota archaeon]
MVYDLVVVGAGPAGSTAARVAADNGLKVALVDKRSRIGFPKQCAEGVNAFILDFLGLKLKKEWISNKIDSALAGCPDKGLVFLKTNNCKGYILDRKKFDSGLADLAVDAGVELLKSSPVVGLENKNTIVRLKSGKNLKARAVIGADGPSSIVARSAGLGVPSSGIGLQYEIKGKIDYPNTIRAFAGLNVVENGFGWIFPKKDTFNIGVGSYRQVYLKERLDNLVKLTGVKGKILETNGGLIPLGGSLLKFYSDNLMLVGDAAGHTNPLTGGGIPAAIFDGELAARILVEELESEKMDFSRYQTEWEKSVFGFAMKNSLIAKKYFLKSLENGYFDNVFKNIGFVRLKSMTDGLNFIHKVRNPLAMFNLLMFGKNFLKIHQFAW